MSRIDDLIAELAPKGVEFKPVGEVTAKSSNIKWANVGDDEFQYIDLSSVDRVTRRIGETASITAGNAPSRAQRIVHTGDVIFATTRPAQMRWAVIPAEYDGQIASTGYCVLRPDTSVVLTNFLAHVLGTAAFRQYVEANQVAGNYPSIPDNRVRAYRIPVPPLEVQREIVRVLDQFTQLEAELEARRRQYEHYRRTALTFDSSVPRVALGDLVRVKTGSSVSKQAIARNPGIYPVINSGREPLGFMGDFNTEGDPIGVTSRGAGVGSITWCEGRYFRGNLNYGVTIKDASQVDVRFLYHSLQYMQPQIQALCSFQGIPALNKANLEKLILPVPSSHEQARIANLLDTFDTLVSDLSIGLPAELNARRKQYEYYRDKLLTFEEAAA